MPVKHDTVDVLDCGARQMINWIGQP